MTCPLPERPRLAVIGASQIAAHLLPRLAHHPALRVLGVAARDPDRARALSAKHGLPRHWSGYDACLADPEVDAVAITTLNTHHFEHARAALSADKHVLCEKPLTLRAADAEALFALASSRGLTLIEGFAYRHQPQVALAARLAREGRIGRLRALELRFRLPRLERGAPSPRDRFLRRSGGGPLADLGCYLIDFAQVVGLDSVPEVFDVRGEGTPELELAFEARLRYANGVESRVAMSYVDGPDVGWEILGERGKIRLAFGDEEEGFARVWIESPDGDEELRLPASDGFMEEYENFSQAIRGLAAPAVSPEQSKRCARILETLRALAVKS